MRLRVLWLLAFASLCLLQTDHALSARSQYELAWRSFVRGDLAKSQQETENAYQRFRNGRSGWAPQFRLLEAKVLLRRGMYDGALRLLAPYHSQPLDADGEIQMLAVEAVALTRQRQIALANQRLHEGESLCKAASHPACGEVLRAQGVFAVAKGDYPLARRFFLDTLSFARSRSDKFLEASAAVDLGWTALQVDSFDEAMDWSRSAYRDCLALGDEEMTEKASGNLGWAYFNLGDGERALELLLQAMKSAARRRSPRSELGWINSAGYVYRNNGDLARASDSYARALSLAKQIDSKEDIINSLEDLTHASIDAGNLSEANTYLQQLNHLGSSSLNRIDALDVHFAEARIAAIRRDDMHAESMFRDVDSDPAGDTSMRLGAEHELARLYESEGRVEEADRMFRTALTTFDSARDRLKDENNKLPFLANASSIYDDFIHLLVSEGKTKEALRIADQSRAQTLAQGLGVTSAFTRSKSLPLEPEAIARKANATLLFYWLGEKQSYLWAISANKSSLFPLPPHREIAQTIERYRKTLLGFQDPLENTDADGIALYRMLVSPASSLIAPGANVVILADGELSRLNFETLIIPGSRPHYLIEDATLISAPSLHLLAAANSATPSTGNLLLVGDAISPNPDYPELPMAAAEMKLIEQNFPPDKETIYARERATAPAYLAANPRQFAYIHFVAHGVASRTDPLDSAIILSRANAPEESFKLHAREIIQHPLQARLVTISACYGSGTRSFAGEGLVGLAWAFLRAGAHNVIGALWEANDESTARLMGDLYQGMEKGMTPGASIRQAKLKLLHSRTEFRKPFYWAPFQIYNGL